MNPKNDSDSILEVVHDESLIGKGTVADPLKMSDDGLIKTFQRRNRAVFYSTTSLSPNFGIVVEVDALALFNNGGRLPEINDIVVDSGNIAGRIFKKNLLSYSISTFYIPRSGGEVSWHDIQGSAMDNADLLAFFGDSNSLKQSYNLNNYVEAINDIIKRIGYFPETEGA